jgi:hypothetical protein
MIPDTVTSYSGDFIFRHPTPSIGKLTIWSKLAVRHAIGTNFPQVCKISEIRVRFVLGTINHALHTPRNSKYHTGLEER